jgi:hypothetical protein
LSEEQQDEELSMLNPLGRARSGGTANAVVKTNKNNYLNSIATRNAVELESEEEEETCLVHKCTNSTNTFVPPYWSFVFSDMSLREYVCITINLPSGMCRADADLDGVLDVSVSPCRTRLLVAMEWPESMTASRCMEQALAGRWKQSRKAKSGSTGSCNQTGTVFNILHAFDVQLHKIRTQNLQSSASNLGGTVSIALPFQVEPETVLCEPTLDETICSVVLKKIFKSKDKLVTSKMTVKVTNGIKQSSSGYGSTYQKSSLKIEKTEQGYSSSGSSTVSNPRQKKSSKK